jgi:two-component system cell cycle sensor histidine kinase/response regulator CckA
MSAATPFPWPLDPSARLSPWFERAPLGIAQCEGQGTVIAMNSALERLLGGSLRSKSALCFGDLVCTGDQAEGERLFRQMLSGERENLQVESRVLAADGSAVWVKWTAWPVRGEDGQPDSALVLAEDATQGRHTEQRLRQAEKLEAVGRLVGGVAHDFNNLLTGVLLYCDLMLACTDSGDRLRKYAQEIRAAGIQATGLVRQLLATARPQPAEPRPISLNEITQGMRNLLVHLIGENIELQFQFDPNLGLVRMDPTQVQQILLNLVLNARDAVATGGRISIETSNCRVQILADSPPGDESPVTVPCALFVVSDDGTGMSSVTRQHLFEAFFTTKQENGTGIGLATVHDIVANNGGLIHVDSEPGSGTRVAVLLPRLPGLPCPRAPNKLEPEI